MLLVPKVELLLDEIQLHTGGPLPGQEISFRKKGHEIYNCRQFVREKNQWKNILITVSYAANEGTEETNKTEASVDVITRLADKNDLVTNI